jgi:hypothetical protein
LISRAGHRTSFSGLQTSKKTGGSGRLGWERGRESSTSVSWGPCQHNPDPTQGPRGRRRQVRFPFPYGPDPLAPDLSENHRSLAKIARPTSRFLDDNVGVQAEIWYLSRLSGRDTLSATQICRKACRTRPS